jgi:signal peptidase I
MDEQKDLIETEIEEETPSETEEVLEETTTDQRDFTIETMKVRKTLRFRMPFVLAAIFGYYILLYFDPHIDFNNVNASLFISITVVIVFFIVGLFVYDLSVKPIQYTKALVYKRYKLLNEVLDIASIVPYLAFLMTVLNVFFFSFAPITGSSMEPNFSDDEAVVFSHLSSSYERFDVVIVHREDSSNPYLIKRVIGLPGERVRISDSYIYIDGVLLDDIYVDRDTVETLCTTPNITDFGEYRSNTDCIYNVPDGFYFVMGDNRDGGAVTPQTGFSVDSRYFGPILEEDIFGKVVFSFKDFNLIN